MKRENLVQRLGKKVIPYLLTGALVFGGLYRCSNDFIEPAPKKPVAMLIAQPTEGTAPLEVSFDGSMSYAREGELEKYLWDFDGDGNTDATTSGASGAYINHIYEEAGEYNAGLVVEDTQGQTSNKDSLEIVVTENIISLGQIAFWSTRPVPETNYNEDIYSGDIVVRVRDDNIELVDIKRLTTAFPAQDLQPAWSPDGSKIVFTSNRDSKIRLYIMNANGTEQTILTPNIQYAANPDWSPDGTKIAFGYRDLGFAGIGIIDPDENSFIPIYSELERGSIPGEPKWSPDCSEISFQNYINGNWEIFLMNADGTNLRNLTNHPCRDLQPVWISNGSGIIFTSDRANPNQTRVEADLYLTNSDGSNVTRLTYAPGGEYDPAISQDAEYIIFTRFSGPFGTPPQVYLTELINISDTSKWIQLTTEGGNRYSAWRPKIED